MDMSGNGGDNAHNNAFGGGKNPGMGHSGSGSQTGSSGKGGNSSSNPNKGSGWSTVNTPQGPLHAYTGGDSGGYAGSKGNSGNKNVVGWGWTSTKNPDVPPYVDANGQVNITITNGLVKTPVYGVPDKNGNSDVHGGYIPASPKDKLATKWDRDNLPKEIDVTVDEYKYQVTLDSNGVVTGVKRTAVRPLAQWEKGKAAIMERFEHKTQQEIYDTLKLNEGESQRQDKAKKQATAAWNNLPPNVRSFNVNVDEYYYTVTLDDYGSVISVKRTAVRPLAQWEKGKAAIMERIEHKTQQEIYDTLKLNEGESQRQEKAKKAAQDVFNSFSMNRDRVQSDVLNKTAEIASNMGDKIGEYLGDKYKAIAKEVADDIKNFQGKTLRTYEQTMESLNKILSNPAMKVNQGDKDALVNAWNSLNASDTANKLSNLSRAFKVADLALKVGKVREKSIEGYKTGNWGPLVLEVESWVLSGVTVGVAMGILGYVAPVVAATVGLPVTAITIAGIIGISYLASFIDDKMADKINNEIIKPVH
ncbi:hypothetical protein G6T08_004908 [Salmonella enterica]|nr:hypothetical protein [Salmonella enterica]EBV4144244.1 hypothetical protein [Salmonella enterica subsp. enterica serovar Benin]EBE6989138.1 hypothetical protein [Salmonella enterica]EBE7299559.1 hypothetical protein [Salmonella enterica]EBW4219539.1 hypothetical protein [Salmonella enterica subsp. enterica serovar Benin]